MKDNLINNVLYFLKCTFLEPAIITKKWTVDYGGWNGGRFESFWSKEKALEFARERKELFVDLENEMTGERIRIRDNPDNIKPPIIASNVLREHSKLDYELENCPMCGQELPNLTDTCKTQL